MFAGYLNSKINKKPFDSDCIKQFVMNSELPVFKFLYLS